MNDDTKSFLKQQGFALEKSDLEAVSAVFALEAHKALRGESSSHQMIDSHLSAGRGEGPAHANPDIVVDAGGTNLHVVVSNCVCRSWSAGIRIAWSNDGTIRNCSFSNIRMRDTSVGIALALPGIPEWNKYDYGREATLVEDLVFEDIEMDGIYGRPILMWMSPLHGLRIHGCGRRCATRLPATRGSGLGPLRRQPFTSLQDRAGPILTA